VVHQLRLLHLLRRHVMRRADHLVLRDRLPRLVGGHDLGDAEVCDLHPPLPVHQHVLRFDVPVHHPQLVRKLQRLANLRHDAQGLFRRNLLPMQQLPQRHPVHILHQQVVKSLRFPEIMHRYDVRVVQPRQRLRLPQEAFGELRIRTPFRCEDFQSHEPV